MALNYSFAGKRVLITGGGQGIGRQLVQRFHDDGAVVFTVDKNPETIQKLKQELPNVTAEVVDLSNWEATRAVVDSFGVIDHLVNNAGIMISETFLEITKEAATKQFDVNLFAMINVTQVVAKGLINSGHGGSIVNISSLASRIGSAQGVIYGASKAGVENLTKSMAVELGQHDIRVNAITPGMVNTPLLLNSMAGAGAIMNEAAIAAMKQRIISKNPISDTNQIADLVMFLLSPLSTMIIGETVVIDGGFSTS